MNHPHQHFLQQFLAWERLGRGALPVSEHPISLEPPFWPFPGYKPPKPKTVDDGSRPTFLSRLVDAGRQPVNEKKEEEEPEIDFDFFERESVVEISVSLPPGFSPKPHVSEALLQQIAECHEPVALELIGTSAEVRLQFSTGEDDAEFLIGALRSFFPEGVFRREPDVAFSAFEAADPSEVAVLDCALGREFLLPLASPRIDPFIGFVGALSEMREGQFSMFQVLFQPVTRPWPDSIFSATLNEEGQPFSWIDPDLAKAVIAKGSQPLFAASVRFCAAANDIDEVCRLLVGLAAPLRQLADPTGNFIAPLELDDAYPVDSQLSDLLNRQSHRFGMLLTLQELLGLVHLPGADVSSPKFVRQVTRTNPAPTSAPDKESLFLGKNEHHGEQSSVYLSTKERTKHMHVLGASGTGKSTFLLNSILQDIRRGHGCALLDPHGDLVEGVLEHLPKDRVQDVILFDPADEEFPVGFNMLSARSEVEKNLLASDFVSIFRRLSAAWGDQMTAVLGNATLAILESTAGGTLLDLRRFLVEAHFRRQFLETVQDPEVRYFWQHEFPLMRGNTQISLLTRLNSFIRQKLIRNMIGQDGNNLDFAAIMDSRKIFLAPLSQGLIGQDNSWLLGSLLVSKFYQIALARQTQAEAERQPFWLYIDEAHNFITESIASILSGTRKYGLGLVLAHQELDQFGRGDSAILSSILTNAHTRICFRVGDQDARRLQDGFQHFEADDLRQLGTGYAICRIGGSDNDFNMIADPPPDEECDPTVAKSARDNSRSQYARPKEEVEAAVNEQIAARAEAVQQEAAEKKARKTKSASTRSVTKTKSAARKPAPEKQESEPDPQEAAAEQELPATAAAPEEPPAAESEADEPPQEPEDSEPQKSQKVPGRGGAKHKALQEQIKAHGNSLGLQASIEAELPDKSGSVDVLLEGQTTKIAIEVALNSPIKQEVRNIEKSLQAGISSILVVSDNKTHLDNIKKAAEAADLQEIETRVRFIEEAEIGDYFAELGSNLASHETESRGYQVSVSYSKLSEKEREARKANIHRAVAETIRKMKQKSSDSAEG